MLEKYPTLQHLTSLLDEYLVQWYPGFFGEKAPHPYSALKPYKVIHDPLWGTNRFSWRELVLIDSPIFQRLRAIHQTGLAHYVYPSAQHSRFEHSLGVTTIASRIFDALNQRQATLLEMIVSVVFPGEKTLSAIGRLRQELRLAALLHDTGHSLHSHASERVYSALDVLKKAADELTSFVGREKGSGEVISFCLAQTHAIKDLLKRAKAKLSDTDMGEFSGDIDLQNVALMIVGRSRHPFLQFMGDIVSSGFDADKLDYLLRDAAAAGLPLRYDLERYLYTVYLEKETLADGEAELEKLYERVKSTPEKKKPIPPQFPFPYYDTYRLRLPKQAMSTIEQIVICKLMLFSYIYHHQKVRAAEGLLVMLLKRMVEAWRSKGEPDENLLLRFISMNDTALEGVECLESKDPEISQCAARIVFRLLPREIYRLTPATSHAEGALLKNFFSDLEDKTKRQALIHQLEEEIGHELLKKDSSFGTSAADALWRAGVWLDVPKPPKFEDMDVLVGRAGSLPGVPIADVFPIGQWTQAYESHRFYVRIFAFSEYAGVVEAAARNAMKSIVRIKDNSFYDGCLRKRKN